MFLLFSRGDTRNSSVWGQVQRHMGARQYMHYRAHYKEQVLFGGKPEGQCQGNGAAATPLMLWSNDNDTLLTFVQPDFSIMYALIDVLRPHSNS